MNTKALLFVSSMVLATSPFISTNSWSNSHEPTTAEDAEECISEEVYKNMTDEEKENTSSDVCEEDEGEGTSQDSDEKPEKG